MSDLQYEAAPMSTANIEAVATLVRHQLQIDEPFFPVLEVIEHFLPALLGEGYTFEVGELGRMGNRHGFVDPVQRTLALREDVYDGLCMHKGRDRFTAAHEIGHMILHNGGLNRAVPNRKLRAYQDPEWQANTFAGFLLMPTHHVRNCRTVSQLISEFGVSSEAAKHRLRKCGLILPA